MYTYVHVSVHTTMCSAGPEVAAGTALKQIQHIGEGGGGGGGGGGGLGCGRTPGSV